MVPAWKSSHADLNTTLKEAGGRSESAGGSHRIRSFLLASEVALAVLLSVSAGLLLRSFVRVTAVNPGVRVAHILTMNLTLPDAKYDTPVKRANFYRDLTERLEALPGVRSAGAVMFLPLRVSMLSFRIGVNGFQIKGRPPVPAGQEPMADYRIATPGYFNTIGIALRKGRLFDQHDELDAKRVALINEAMAARHFPHENPLGQHITTGRAHGNRGRGGGRQIVRTRCPGRTRHLRAAHAAPSPSPWGWLVQTEGDPAAMLLGRAPRDPQARPRTAHLQRAHHGERCSRIR